MMFRGTGTVLASVGNMSQPIISEDSDLTDGGPFNMFGNSLAWADTDGTGQLDLIIGAPTAMTGSLPLAAGRVFVAHAEAGKWPFEWSLTGVSDGSPQLGQQFGWAVARAARGGTALADLLVGSPRSKVLGHADAGEVFVFSN